MLASLRKMNPIFDEHRFFWWLVQPLTLPYVKLWEPLDSEVPIVPIAPSAIVTGRSRRINQGPVSTHLWNNTPNPGNLATNRQVISDNFIVGFLVGLLGMKLQAMQPLILLRSGVGADVVTLNVWWCWFCASIFIIMINIAIFIVIVVVIIFIKCFFFWLLCLLLLLS